MEIYLVTLLDNLRWKLLKREEGRRMADFKYVCVGYSVHMDSKDKDPSTNADAGARNPSNPQGKRSELPFCTGIEQQQQTKLQDMFQAVLQHMLVKRKVPTHFL
ncbi:hypothetical protein C5167_029693 [Papaver somniferum]|nr:hypothetical protein C5167_029693 [Papaver somniferum]